jgi:biotin operon repressor
MDEQEKAEQQIKELKEQGYKTFEERERKRKLKQALQDYDRHLSCPYG